ncbi:MAG: tRNA uridine-5-carboxymethylaminomethyl(34) synthesis GTPase MnmE [Alphaproteobacteria bacterium]|nr:tRNA uridine-5-carboxymethylaminomethyl(34) synthesis GTPase MnmE [Alphaproteobacteria bacterium]
MNTTVYALATAPGRAGVAIIRLSGSAAVDIALRLTKRKSLKPRTAHHCRFFDAAGHVIDDGLVLYFPAPHSYTGEDVVELHCHGSPAAVKALLAFCGAQLGCRHAEPGEFTRRALLAGKINFSYAEGLADLLDAETEAQRQLSRQLMDGQQAQRFYDWSEALRQLLALHEALLDFSDEDLPASVPLQQRARLETLTTEIEDYLKGAAPAQLLRDGYRVVLTGNVNAGKSSLFNALCGRNAALVSDIAGTTRDVLEVRLDIGGYPILLTDSAGQRDTGDTIEAMGIAKAQEALAAAQLILWVIAAPEVPSSIPLSRLMPDYLCGLSVPVLAVVSKSDMAQPLPADLDRPHVLTSLYNRDSLQVLHNEILTQLQLSGDAAATLSAVSARQQDALQKTVLHLREALSETDAALAAESLRHAWRCCQSLYGEADSDRVLDDVFSRFCIGK